MESVAQYYKGHSIKDGRQMIYKVHEKPQDFLLEDEKYMVEASAIETTGVKYYKTIKSCEVDNYIEREISESEYECYVSIQRLLTEMFLHDYTGGFPRVRNVFKIARELPRQIRTWVAEIGC